MDLQQLFHARQSRQSVLRKLGRLASGGLALDAGAFSTGALAAPVPVSWSTPIKHDYLIAEFVITLAAKAATRTLP